MTKTILQQCLLSTESPIVLAARKKLYDWLVKKLKAKPDWKVLQGVSVDKINAARNVDCIVQTPDDSFAYLIIDKSLQAGDLTALENMIRENQWALNVVFTKVWLRCSDRSRRHLYLSEMEKRFISHRKYDLTVSHSEKVLGSLTYFDADSDSIVLLRRIRAGSSSKYCCDVIECRLEDMLMSPTTGEFVGKSEDTSYKKRKIRKERFGKKVADKKAAKEIRRPDDCWIDIVTGREIRSSEPVKSDDQRWGTCEICGDYTNYWWSFDDNNLICKCKKCSGGGQHEDV